MQIYLLKTFDLKICKLLFHLRSQAFYPRILPGYGIKQQKFLCSDRSAVPVSGKYIRTDQILFSCYFIHWCVSYHLEQFPRLIQTYAGTLRTRQTGDMSFHISKRPNLLISSTTASTSWYFDFGTYSSTK